MNIHEYQAKSVLSKYNVPVPKGIPAFTVDEAVKAAEELGGPIWVVKAQIHAGGRGKAGGVKVVKSIDDVRTAAEKILGATLVTHQTGPEGKEVKRLYVEDGSDIQNEYYLSMLVDRATSKVTIIASIEGGMDIEEVAEKEPEKIITIPVDVHAGVTPADAKQVSDAFGLSGAPADQVKDILENLYKCFWETDASQVEINPLAQVGPNGDIIALDAKFNFDDNALFRHPDIEEMRDEEEEEPTEREASKHELSYVKMDGNIGCMVNGAGLAMATMDIIKLNGAEPANFLDVGGGATKERVTTAFKLILSDPNVEGILVNIFGGIMRCDVIAEGVIAAAKELSVEVPLVVRLEGTNVEKGKDILSKSGLDIISADNLGDAAEKIVSAVQDRKAA
jgi:succinyl-CoA synthetase beta subunit